MKSCDICKCNLNTQSINNYLNKQKTGGTIPPLFYITDICSTRRCHYFCYADLLRSSLPLIFEGVLYVIYTCYTPESKVNINY